MLGFATEADAQNWVTNDSWAWLKNWDMGTETAPWPLADVRLLGESGGEALVLSVSAYDPKPTYEANAGQPTRSVSRRKAAQLARLPLELPLFARFVSSDASWRGLLAIRAIVSTDGRTAFRAFLISSYA